MLVDYYEGAYGPTIRINAQSTVSIAQVKSIFWELATGKVYEVNLHKVECIEVINIKALVLKRVSGDKESRKTLQLVQTTPEGPVFHWERSSEGWMDCAELTNGLLQHGHPGHQYLTDESIDDALVEIALLE